jgi:broad specificity phosphatase PhoE
MTSVNVPPRLYDRLRHSRTGSTHLYLVRHGQTSGNTLRQLIGHTDIPLDELGLRQADEVGRAMRSVPLDAVISSPLERARVTAIAIAGHHGLPVELDERLKEMHFGDAEGLTFAEAAAKFPHLAELAADPLHEHFTWPGGDHRTTFHKKVFASLTELVLAHLDRHVAIVCHGGVISSFIAQLDGGSPNDYATYPVANCSITYLEVHAEGTTAHRLNDTAHLEIVETSVFNWVSSAQDNDNGEGSA